MNREFRQQLRECLEEFTASGDVEASVSGRAGEDEIRPYLSVAAALRRDALMLPPGEPRRSGRERLLSALQTNIHHGGAQVGILQSGMVRAGAAALVGVLFVGGVAGGVSAAAGGPNLAGEVVHAIKGINHAPEQAATGKEHANGNAFEGSDNAAQGHGNASANGQQHANANASEGADNATQGSGNASANGQQHANANASEGADNATQGSGNASANGQQNANANAPEGADNAAD